MEHEGCSNKSSLSESDDKSKSVSSQVLEYYKRYSQNRALPKYFSGASTSSFRIEDWYEQVKRSPISNVQDCTTVAVSTEEISEETIKPVLSQSVSPMAGQDQLCESSKVSDINICVTSPTSSVASNRKLEWDNGADIGYSNVEASNKSRTLKKSISLPIINTLECKDFKDHLPQFTYKDRSIENLQLKQSDTCADTNPTVIPFKPSYSSTSTSESIKSSKHSYTSSSSTDDNQQYLSSDSELINDMQKLKNKMRRPIAESTPIIKTNSEMSAKDKLHSNGDTLNGSLKKWHSQLDLNMVDRISFYKNMKILKLSVAKPIVIECRGVYEPLPGRDKDVQTSLPRNPSIAVQTDFDLTGGIRKDASTRQMERQSILYVCHSDSDKETNIHSSTATQTNSDASSNCNSFEYLSGNDYDRNLQKEAVETSEINDIEIVPGTSKENEIVIPGNLRKCPPRSDLSTMTAPSSTSKGSTSSDLSFSKQSEDLEKKLQLLKKIIKSKKYDRVAKKSCLKKVVSTMLDSKFSDESSGSSKKSEVGEIIREKKSATASDVSDTVLKSEEDKLNLHDNKPWLPVQLEDLCVKENQMSLKKLQTQTFIDEILPENGKSSSEEAKSNNIKPRLQRNQLLTLTSDRNVTEGNENDKYDHGDSSNSATNDLYDTINPTTSATITPLISSDHSNQSNKGLQSWRENKTRSEELLEQKNFNNKDHLVNFAKKEREQQLYWINNEISHLHKLKNLLENDAKSKNNETQIQDDILNKILQKPHVEDMKGLKKSTTLYIVTTEKSSGTSKCSSTQSGCSKASCKNSCCRGRYISLQGNSKSPSRSPSRHSKSPPRSPSRHSKSPSKSPSKHSGSPARSPSRHSGSSSRSPNRHIKFQSESCKCKHSISAPCACRRDQSRPVPGPCTQSPRPVCTDTNIINCENGKFDLKNARLLSSQQYTTNTNDVKFRTSIRRYTFEIPMENVKSQPQTLQPSCSGEIIDPKPCTSTKRSKSPCSPPVPICSDVATTCSKKDAATCFCGCADVKECCTNTSPLEKCTVATCPCGCADVKDCCTNTSPREKCTVATCPCGCPDVKDCCTNTSPRITRESCTVTACPCKDDKPTQTYACKKDQATSPCTARTTPCQIKPVSCTSSVSSSSSSESYITIPSSSTQLCHCCKQRYSDYRRSSLQNDNTRYILCHPCYYNNQGKHYYTLPGHVCTCYNKQMDTVEQIRETIHQLENLEKEEEFCKCSYRKSHSSSGYCSKCGCKLRDSFRKNKGGLAYVITLESDEDLNKKCRKKREHVLEEIKIKVPSPRSKCKKFSTDCSKSGEESGKENSSCRTSRKCYKKNKHKKSHKPTLQEYLCANKPGFIASAEQRRQCLLDLAYMREQRCQKYKQLLALTSGIPFKNNTDRNKPCEKQHVFTTKEMKKMTARHYKKLPEVQHKLEQNKEQQIRKANKLLADIFNQRLRQQVLRGKHTIPADASIINLV